MARCLLLGTRMNAPRHAWLCFLLGSLGCGGVEAPLEPASSELVRRPGLEIDDVDPRLVYSGAWERRLDSYHLGSSGAVELSFLGEDWDQVDFYGCRGPRLGSLRVRIDGVAQAMVQEFKVGPLSCDLLLYSSKVLGPGPHVFRAERVAGAVAFDKLVLSKSKTPKRLGINGRSLLDEGQLVKLRGGNFEGLAPKGDEAAKRAEVLDFTETLRLNFARYRISFDNVSDRPSCLSEEQERYVDDVHYLTEAKVWVLLEMRAEDAWTSDSPDFYLPGSALNDRYKCAWSYVVERIKNLPYIAGYGVLAEPSANKNFPAAESMARLQTFQIDLMNHLTHHHGDTWTPFFLGPDFNYDTMQLRLDEGHDGDRYFSGLPAAYQRRVVYEVNFLNPKPWINEGALPGPDLKEWDLGAPIAYPQPNPGGDSPFDYFITPNAGPFSGEEGLEMENVFSRHREDPAKFPRLLSPAFIDWYLSFALGFAARNNVPMVVDQFGAADRATDGRAVMGQVAFEADLISYFEAHQLGWSRWGYNAGDANRRMNKVEDSPIRRLYMGLAP